MCGKENYLETEIRKVINYNLLGIEENIRENLILSHGELGIEADISISLSEYIDEFVKDIMEIICRIKN